MKDSYKDVINEIKLVIKKYEKISQDLDCQLDNMYAQRRDLYRLNHDHPDEQLALFSVRISVLTTHRTVYKKIVFDLSNTDAILHDDD